MKTPDLAKVASIIGNPSRAAMLSALLGGQSLLASELARIASISPQTASAHLAKMMQAGLIGQEAQGRHRYYRLANPEVGQALESLNVIAPMKPVRSLRESQQLQSLRFARTCYDHLAGQVGVAVADALLNQGLLKASGPNFILTEAGEQWFQAFGIKPDALRKSRRHFARQCLDWSERRNHLAGALGAAFAAQLFERHWMRTVPGSRALRFTEEGLKSLSSLIGHEALTM